MSFAELFLHRWLPKTLSYDSLAAQSAAARCHRGPHSNRCHGSAEKRLNDKANVAITDVIARAERDTSEEDNPFKQDFSRSS